MVWNWRWSEMGNLNVNSWNKSRIVWNCHICRASSCCFFWLNIAWNLNTLREWLGRVKRFQSWPIFQFYHLVKGAAAIYCEWVLSACAYWWLETQFLNHNVILRDMSITIQRVPWHPWTSSLPYCVLEDRGWKSIRPGTVGINLGLLEGAEKILFRNICGAYSFSIFRFWFTCVL